MRRSKVANGFPSFYYHHSATGPILMGLSKLSSNLQLPLLPVLESPCHLSFLCHLTYSLFLNAQIKCHFLKEIFLTVQSPWIILLHSPNSQNFFPEQSSQQWLKHIFPYDTRIIFEAARSWHCICHHHCLHTPAECPSRWHHCSQFHLDLVSWLKLI